ncbi:MAG: methyl-accepting chemotaxis protein [Lachnospiraceae bacterium]|nr:methyl-accepting chemotaxis protein [Lachnospiraceae bacterium]
MKTRRLSIKWKIMIWIFVIYLSICLLVNIFYNNVRKFIVEETCVSTLGMVEVVVSEIDGDKFSSITSVDDENYKEIYDIMARYRDNAGIKCIYSMDYKDGKVRFVVDTDIEAPADFHEEYDNDMVVKTFETGEATYDEEITSDSWGKLLGTYTPIRNSKDKVVGVIGCDINVDEISNELDRLTNILHMCMGGFLIACVLVTILLTKGVVKNIKKLLKKLRNLNNGTGSGERLLNVTSGDEVEVVAEEFNIFIKQFDLLVENVSGVSVEIQETADDLNSMIEKSNGKLEKMAGNIQTINVGMTETSTNTSIIADKLSEAVTTVIDINNAASKASKKSKRLGNGADKAKNEIQAAGSKTMETINEFKKKLVENTERCKEIEKIDLITTDILTVANTTRILAQNTHIEANRTGEYGNGFSVIARNLNGLNEQIRNMVNNIRETNTEVKSYVNDFIESINELIEYLEENTIKDYEAFEKMGNEYVMAMSGTREVLDKFNSDTKNVTYTIKNIEENIGTINKMIKVAANNISDVNLLSEKVEENVKNLVEISDKNLENSEVIVQEMSQYTDK